MLRAGKSTGIAIVTTVLAAASAQAAPVSYTDDASFLAAVPGANVVTFEGLPVPTDAVQQLTVGGASGSYTLTFNGQTTAALAFNATPGEVQTALDGLSTIGGVGGGVTVASGGGGALDVTFTGALADTNVAPLSATPSGGASATSSIVTAGHAGASFPSGAPGPGNIAAFVYDQGGNSLSVATSPGATSGVNVLDGFRPGQSLDLAFASPVNAAGLFVIASQPLAPGQVSLVAGGAMSEAQRLEVGGTTGTYTLTFNGQTTSALGVDATPGQIQTALNALSSIGGIGGSVAVAASGGGAFTMTFGGVLADTGVSPVTGTGGGGASVALGTLIDGTSGGATFTAVNGAVAAPGQSEVQQLTVGGAPSGTYTLTFNGQTTAALAAGATAAQVQAALDALSTIGGIGGSVTVAVNGAALDVTFAGALANIGVGSIGTAGAGGTTATISTLVTGASGSSTLPAALGVNEVQSITITGSPSGTYTLTFNGQTTSALAANATAAEVQTALNALGSIGGVGGSVTVAVNGAALDVTFGGTLADTGLSLLSASGVGGTIATTGEIEHGASAVYAYFIGMSLDATIDDIAVDFAGTATSYLLDDITSGVTPQSEVPEPSSLVLLGAGLAMLGCARRRFFAVASRVRRR